MEAGGASRRTDNREVFRPAEIHRDVGTLVGHARESQRRVGFHCWMESNMARSLQKVSNSRTGVLRIAGGVSVTELA